MRTKIGLLAACCMLSLVAALPAVATTTVTVRLEDPSTGPAVHRMELLASPSHVPAGVTIFHVENLSKDLVHETLVIRPPASGRLPYDAKDKRLIESRVDKVGDSGDLKPGTATTMKVALKPGKYLLICNEPGHYKGGMHAWLTVNR
ncbi:MAG: hypothetical protein ACREFY_13575 [Acetobacteraceae bacterium]